VPPAAIGDDAQEQPPFVVGWKQRGYVSAARSGPQKRRRTSIHCRLRLQCRWARRICLS